MNENGDKVRVLPVYEGPPPDNALEAMLCRCEGSPMEDYDPDIGRYCAKCGRPLKDET